MFVSVCFCVFFCLKKIKKKKKKKKKAQEEMKRKENILNPKKEKRGGGGGANNHTMESYVHSYKKVRMTQHTQTQNCTKYKTL